MQKQIISLTCHTHAPRVIQNERHTFKISKFFKPKYYKYENQIFKLFGVFFSGIYASVLHK
jgi:hypothetical protein